MILLTKQIIRNIMGMTPLQNHFLFQFFNETREGRFMERSKGQIILSHSHNDFESQAKYARWGKVLAIGPKVDTLVPGDIVLIEYGKWTTGIDVDGNKVWKSDEDHVCAITDDESITYAF